MVRWWTARALLTAYLLVAAGLLLLLPDRSPREEEAVAVISHAGAPVVQERSAWWHLIFRPSLPMARELLRGAIPGLDPTPELGPAPSDLVVYLVTGAQLSQPHAFFETMMPFLAARPSPEMLEGPALAAAAPMAGPIMPEAEAEAPEPAPDAPIQGPPLAPPDPVTAGQPLVGIYHTHDWESYIDQVSPGTDPLLMNSNDPSRSVIRVGKELAKALQQQGIAVVHSPALHQKDGYLGAYGLSRETAKQILARYPSVRVLIDLHRDALPRDKYVANIGGQSVARLDLVIGEGDANLPQPRWAENQAFAQVICTAVNARHAGLCRGVLVKNDRYNQDLLPGAVLIEVGTATNTMEESLRVVNLLAPVLADLVRQGRYPKG